MSNSLYLFSVDIFIRIPGLAFYLKCRKLMTAISIEISMTAIVSNIFC